MSIPVPARGLECARFPTQPPPALVQAIAAIPLGDPVTSLRKGLTLERFLARTVFAIQIVNRDGTMATGGVNSAPKRHPERE